MLMWCDLALDSVSGDQHADSFLSAYYVSGAFCLLCFESSRGASHVVSSGDFGITLIVGFLGSCSLEVVHVSERKGLPYCVGLNLIGCM